MSHEKPYLTLPDPQELKKEAKRILASQPFPLTFGQKEWTKKWTKLQKATQTNTQTQTKITHQVTTMEDTKQNNSTDT